MARLSASAADSDARERFFAEVNAGFARLRADPVAWADYQAELAEWDQTLSDGLMPEAWADEQA
jgi:hypothetical protein